MSLADARHVVVTGTDTSVGKTVVTAALAVALEASGRSVTVVKPVQTGVGPTEPGDADTVAALGGLADVRELVRLELPLAPESAARAVGADLPTIAEHARIVRDLGADVVLVEGAGGLLVRLDHQGGTIRDLAVELDADVVVVAREGLGTLNHVELTLASLAEAGLRAHVVLGACSPDPGLAERSNRTDLPRLTRAPLLGAIPAGAGRLPTAEFRSRALDWFDPSSLR